MLYIHMQALTHLPTHTYFSLHYPCSPPYSIPTQFLSTSRKKKNLHSTIIRLNNPRSIFLIFSLFFLVYHLHALTEGQVQQQERFLWLCCAVTHFRVEDIYNQNAAIISPPVRTLDQTKC